MHPAPAVYMFGNLKYQAVTAVPFPDNWQAKPGEFIAICEVCDDLLKALQPFFRCSMMQRKTCFYKFFVFCHGNKMHAIRIRMYRIDNACIFFYDVT